MTIKIVTDSTATLPKELIEKYAITVVPLSFSIEGVIFTDGDLTLSEYMDKMDAAENLPKTSQPPVGVFSEVYHALTADGSTVISVHMSSTLSGTVEAARQGAMLVPGNVHVVDSGYTDQALGFQVLEAAELAEAGKTPEEILSALAKMRENTDLFCGVSSLRNLVKGGRVGRVSGLIGSILDVRVVLYMKDGALSQFKKGRGAKTFKKWLDEMADTLTNSGRKIKEIGITHVEALDFAETMRATLQKFVDLPIQILETTPIIATHTGRGAFALMFVYE
ncbi:MAG: DegV family protein [Streptococcaceae bacterium]|jgi:DegV family protein with EDD domain|nr:DegV family protein [Streptococcaceae bacterium]